MSTKLFHSPAERAIAYRRLVARLFDFRNAETHLISRACNSLHRRQDIVA